MRRNADGTLDLSHLGEINPDVAEVIGAGRRRIERRSQTPAQRRAADRSKVTVDIPPDVKDELDRIADQLSVPLSQVYQWLLLRGLEHTSLDELREARKPSRSMRYEYVLFASPKRQP